MKLTLSPARTVEKILEQLESSRSPGDQVLALKQLSELSVDGTFAQEFINHDGLTLIINKIETESWSGELLAFALKSFVELMDHNLVSWDHLEPKFIKSIANCVTSGKMLDNTTFQASLEILESIVLHSDVRWSQVDQDVSHTNLVPFLQNANAEVQKNALALINAMFQRADLDRRKKMADSLQSRSIRNIILQGIIHKGNVSPDMAHQLYVLQCLLFSLLYEKCHTPVDPSDQVAQSSVQDLRQMVFDMDSEAKTGIDKRSSQEQDFKKLGFQNAQNPVEDFRRTPPGILALSNMVHFAKNYRENYTKVVLENSGRSDDHDLPFARASIELTNVMCEILKVGEQPSDEGQIYYPIFFTHDHAFEEFYCICIQLVNKTWKEMKATSIDFTKVFDVVREQISRALQYQLTQLDQLRTKLGHLSYQDITNLRQAELFAKEQEELLATPIQELKERIMPEMIELIKQQRLNYLVNGTRFSIKLGRRSDKFFYCRLSPNHKVFHYGDCDENAVPTIEQLPSKLAVSDVKEVVTGRECPHARDKSKKINPNLAFSLTPTENFSTEAINFVAASDEIFNIWTDGINALLGKKMISPLMQSDLSTLLTMEIKLRLLDTEGITIPSTPPPIPPDPPNYDFSIKT